MFDGAIDWMKNYGVPTLAGSRLVLTDFWEEKWPPWIVGIYQWLLANRYRPILAHPERMPAGKSVATGLDTLVEMGVWRQGNLRCFTGEDGYQPDQNIRKFTRQGQYHFMALDMHGLECLEGRLDGMQLMAQEFGSDLLDELTIDAPRRLILG